MRRTVSIRNHVPAAGSRSKVAARTPAMPRALRRRAGFVQALTVLWYARRKGMALEDCAGGPWRATARRSGEGSTS